MRRYFLRISYDGTSYHGWQAQPNAVTVQGVLDDALKVLLRSETETVGCGRTDAGVHSKCFYLHFDVEQPVEDSSKFIHSLNAILPLDIAAYELIAVSNDAHARFDATLRTYEYHLTSLKDPFLAGRAYHYTRRCDFDKMNEAAALLMNHAEYGCFCKGRSDEQTTECRVSHAEWSSVNGHQVFTVSANRFLRNMVRAIVGTLLEVGEGTLDLEGFREVLYSGDRSEAGRSVPGHGLYLTDVRYPFITR